MQRKVDKKKRFVWSFQIFRRDFLIQKVPLAFAPFNLRKNSRANDKRERRRQHLANARSRKKEEQNVIYIPSDSNLFVMGDSSQQQQQYALVAQMLAAQHRDQNVQNNNSAQRMMENNANAQNNNANNTNTFHPQFPFVNYNLHGQPVVVNQMSQQQQQQQYANNGKPTANGQKSVLVGATMAPSEGHFLPQNTSASGYTLGGQQQPIPTHHTVNGQTVKVRKPYTITKQRERWTEREHDRFVEALKLHGRAWRKIEEHIGTKTAVQIRSHAQKFFAKLQKEHQKNLEADQLSDVTRGGGTTEDGATATRDTQTSGEGGLTQTTTENIKDADTAKKISGNNNSKLLIQALMGKKSKSEVTGNTKEEDEAELLSNLAASGDKPATVKRTSSMSTGGKTTASDIPPARPKRKPSHPYPRKQSSLTEIQVRGVLPVGFVNVNNKKKGHSINNSLIDVANVEQHASASAAQALMNATSEMVRNRMIQEMQMQHLLQQQQQQRQNNKNGNNNDTTANPLLAHLAMQQEVPNPLSQLHALMAANPMFTAMNFGGGLPGMPNMAAVAANSNGGSFIPSFATMNNNNNNNNAKLTTTTDANNNKSGTEEAKPTTTTTTDKTKNSEVSEDAKASLKPNSQSAFSGYVRPTTTTTTTNSNQYRQTGSAATTTTTANNINNSSNNNNDSAVMAAVQQHQQMQYWNAQMAALAAMQDPNSFAQFLQHQQMGNMAMAQQQRQQQNNIAYAAGVKSEAAAATQEKNAAGEVKTARKAQAATQTPAEATDAGKTAKMIAASRKPNAPQVPKEIELAVANKEKSPDSDKATEEEENKNADNSNKDTITNTTTTTTTTGRRSRRAAAVVAAEKVTKQVSGGRATRRSNNGGSGSGSGSGSRNQNQPGGNKNQGSSGSDGSDDVAQKGFETTSFRVYQQEE